MSAELLIVVLVVGVALAFDFTNGFHDTANAMATSIATGALAPKVAVTLAAVFNLIGAFLSIEVALTVTNAVVNVQTDSGAPIDALTENHGEALLVILLAGLVGAILWNLVTWLFGLPSSSSHALFGGLLGATIAGLGWGGVKWTGDGTELDGVIGKVILPAVSAPLIAGAVAAIGTWLVYRIMAGAAHETTLRGFRWGQVVSASLVSLAHGSNDAQKTMGVITLALIAYGSWTDTEAIPMWVKVTCALAIALGTYVGGWRIIRTMGKGLVDLESPQGMAAEGSTAAVILASSQLGFPLSTTQATTGAILGTGLGRPGAQVRWRVAGRMLVAWVLTMPCAGLIAAATWWLADRVGGAGGAVLITLILAVASGLLYLQSRGEPINSTNVNDEWRGTPSAGRRREPVGS